MNSYLKGNCIKMLLPELTANMLYFQLFLIIGATATAIETKINLKLLPSTEITTLETKGTISTSNHNIDDKPFVQFLKYISQEQSFTTIVILTNWQHTTAKVMATGTATTTKSQQNDYCVNLKLYMEYFQHHEKHQQQTLVPVMLLQSKQTDYILHKKFNSEFVAIVCIPPLLPLTQRQVITKVTQNHLLHALSKNLLHLRKNRVIVRMEINNHEGENLQNIENILKYCDMEQIINIMIISYQFPYNDTIYYSYEKFPEFKLLVQKYNWSKGGQEQKLFPNKLRNLKGYKLLTLPDQIIPRSIAYTNKQGQQKLGGYVGHFVNYFAKALNATLAFAFKVQEGVPILYSEILKFTRNNTVDIAASLTPRINNTDWWEFSYPFEIANFCVMLPLEAEISMAEIFVAVLNPYFLSNILSIFLCFTFLFLLTFKRIYPSLYHIHLVDILINDKALRGILAQSFPFKYRNLDYFAVGITILKDFAGFVVVTLYGVFLGSFITSAPKYPPIKSFADLEKSGIKLSITRAEYAFIYPSDYIKYPKLFHIIDSYKEFVFERSTLNTSNAYTASSSQWPIFATQQKFFSRRLFRYSNDLCFIRYLHLYFMLSQHSVFRETLHSFILKSYSSGLFYHWFDLSFYELVSLGRMSFTDITEPRQLKPISVSDLILILKGFCFLLMLSVAIFVLEIMMSGYIKWKKNKLKSRRISV